MNIGEVLAGCGINIRDARRLMAEVLDESFERVFLLEKNEISALDLEKFNQMRAKFLDDTPFEYISKRCEFMGREFMVDERVLIPRPETELLVTNALNELVKTGFCGQILRIIDVATGSGIVAITLYHELKNLGINAKIIASDISSDALDVARKNGQKLGAQIEFINCSLLNSITGTFDLIISNPPYIADDYKLQNSVLKEPSIALFGGKKGDELLLKLIEQSAGRTKILACEMGYDQLNSLSAKLAKFGFRASFYKDFSGFDRGFIAKWL